MSGGYVRSGCIRTVQWASAFAFPRETKTCQSSASSTSQKECCLSSINVNAIQRGAVVIQNGTITCQRSANLSQKDAHITKGDPSPVRMGSYLSVWSDDLLTLKDAFYLLKLCEEKHGFAYPPKENCGATCSCCLFAPLPPPPQDSPPLYEYEQCDQSSVSFYTSLLSVACLYRQPRQPAIRVVPPFRPGRSRNRGRGRGRSQSRSRSRSRGRSRARSVEPLFLLPTIGDDAGPPLKQHSAAPDPDDPAAEDGAVVN